MRVCARARVIHADRRAVRGGAGAARGELGSAEEKAGAVLGAAAAHAVLQKGLDLRLGQRRLVIGVHVQRRRVDDDIQLGGRDVARDAANAACGAHGGPLERRWAVLVACWCGGPGQRLLGVCAPCVSSAGQFKLASRQ
eukprot:COSAG02_NODE_6516_length_3523_cov_24.336449_3_plen_139_part_00